MKERRVLVAVIERNRVTRITMVDWWKFKDPFKPEEMVDISQMEPRPEIGSGYMRGVFFIATKDHRLKLRIRAKTL